MPTFTCNFRVLAIKHARETCLLYIIILLCATLFGMQESFIEFSHIGSVNNVTHTHISCTGATAFEGAKYGEGDGLILLDDLTCTGSEGRLVDCLQVNDCEHNEDAGVKCLKPQGRLHMIQSEILCGHYSFCKAWFEAR